jgi:hypothetical protein
MFAARPVHILSFINLQQHVELFDEEILVVVQIIAEEGKGLDKSAAPGDDLGASIAQPIERGELLEDTHRVVGAENRNGTGKPDMFRLCRRGRECDRHGRDRIVGPVMFAQPVDIDPDLIGEDHLFDHVA